MFSYKKEINAFGQGTNHLEIVAVPTASLSGSTRGISKDEGRASLFRLHLNRERFISRLFIEVSPRLKARVCFSNFHSGKHGWRGRERGREGERRAGWGWRSETVAGGAALNTGIEYPSGYASLKSSSRVPGSVYYEADHRIPPVIYLLSHKASAQCVA